MKDRTLRSGTRRMVALAMFAALAYACVFLLHIKVAFLTFDAKDAVITIAGMFFGSASAVILSLLVSLLELITISDTGLYGFLMNFVGSAVFGWIASGIYRWRKTMTGAVIGLLGSVLGMTAVMVVMNLLITPLFIGGTVEEVHAMIPTLLLPFNLIKAVLNASLVLVLYKAVATALRRTRLVEGSGTPAAYRMNRRSVAVLAVGIVLIVVSVILFLTVLDGTFVLWE